MSKEGIESSYRPLPYCFFSFQILRAGVAMLVTQVIARKRNAVERERHGGEKEKGTAWTIFYLKQEA